MSEVTEQQLEDMQALFVQTATSMTSDRGTITLHGVSPSTLYFADRPQREVGTCRLVSSSPTGQQGTTASPTTPRTPSCRSRTRATGLPRTRSEIEDPRLDGDALSYGIKVLDGTVPAATGPCALFIDPLGRPLSPVSVAGMHRRLRASSGALKGPERLASGRSPGTQAAAGRWPVLAAASSPRGNSGRRQADRRVTCPGVSLKP